VTHPIYIYDAVRTARGKARPDGGLHHLAPADQVALLLKALEKRLDVDPSLINDVVLGCVTQIGDQGGNIARTSVLVAGWPDQIPGISVNRYCTSGLDATVIAASKIAAGVDKVVIAGGVEAMSRVPVMSDKGAYYLDPDISKRSRFIPLGVAADLLATRHKISREKIDAYALMSQQRAAKANQAGNFKKSIIPVPNQSADGYFDTDEIIRGSITREQLAALPAAFTNIGEKGCNAFALAETGTNGPVRHVHTAGNSPAMADGASLLLLAGANNAGTLKPRAKIRSMANISVDPVIMLTGGIIAAEQALVRAGLKMETVDLVEFNEAFGATVVKFMRDTNCNTEKLNVNGGAIALGHAMGSTGTCLIGTALDELERRDLETALIAISGGAGVGTALVIERI